MSRRRPVPGRGLSLAEVVVVLALLGLGAAILLPLAATLGRAGRGAAAARELATTFQALRWKSVATRRSHGLVFDRDERGWYWHVVRDGNGNGLRTAEIRGGVDAVLSGPHRLEERVSGVRLGIPADRDYPAIPPRRGPMAPTDDPVRFGRSDLISFSPLGTASSGTLFLTDPGQELLGVVLFGPTVRVRVWRFDERVGRWRL